MSINYNAALETYVAQNERGEVMGIFDPKVHGTVDGFRNAMGLAGA